MSRDMAHRLGMTPNENGMYQFGVLLAHIQSTPFVNVREDTGAPSVSVVSFDVLVNPTPDQQRALTRWMSEIDARQWHVTKEDPSTAFASSESMGNVPANISAIFAR